MNWKVEFYDLKVKDSIKNWPKHLWAKFLKIVELIKQMGPHELGMPHVKSLAGGLFEIRAKSDEGIARAIFCIRQGRVVIILCGFIKKTQKIPAKELELAKKRMMEIKNNG